MFVRCMLPLSLVEQDGFRDWIKGIDPSFKIPTRKTLRCHTVSTLKDRVEAKIVKLFSDDNLIINTSVDGWSDSSMRCFNGYIGQFIDHEWKLKTINFGFEYVTGI